MKKNVRLFNPIFYTLIAVCLVITLLTLFYDTNLFYISAAISIAGLIYVLIRVRFINKDIHVFLQFMGQTLSSAQQESLVNFPLPVMVVRENKEIIWHNELCREIVLSGEDWFGYSFDEILPEIDVTHDCPPNGYNISYKNKFFTVYTLKTEQDGNVLYLVYFIDDTDLKRYTKEFFETRLSVMLMRLDNYEELMKSSKENEKSQLMGEIEYVIETFVEDNKGLLLRLDKENFVALIEQRNMEHIVRSKFEILDKIRAVVSGDRMPATLSIGVGSDGKTLQESEQFAQQALDMCLGRGGDQVALKTKNGYDFYGGVSKGVEKRNRVKSRIVANAISELIDTSDNVLVMGHRFADLDCLGSAIGMARAIALMGKPSAVVLNKSRNLATPLYERMVENGFADLFVEPDQALQLAGKKTLLIIMDTHVKHFLESPQVYEACKNIVVIDHHRRMVDYIDNAVIFYHEPFASSASEMVSELVQYFNAANSIGRLEAEALLAGIMLDTKNFAMKTGVRTFEAAAYLRRLGADTVEVRKMFASSMEDYQNRTKIVSEAEVYHNCAIAVCNETIEDIKIVAAQAADELLSISDVDASFVLYDANDEISISGRSMGALNVQLVLEALGGGGHLTMAGAQLKNMPMEDAKHQLLEAIDQYYAQKNN